MKKRSIREEGNHLIVNLEMEAIICPNDGIDMRGIREINNYNVGVYVYASDDEDHLMQLSPMADVMITDGKRTYRLPMKVLLPISTVEQVNESEESCEYRPDEFTLYDVNNENPVAIQASVVIHPVNINFFGWMDALALIGYAEDGYSRTAKEYFYRFYDILSDSFGSFFNPFAKDDRSDRREVEAHMDNVIMWGIMNMDF